MAGVAFKVAPTRIVATCKRERNQFLPQTSLTDSHFYFASIIARNTNKTVAPAEAGAQVSFHERCFLRR